MNDDELRQMMALMENYRARIDALTRQVNLIRATIEEVNMANQSIRSIIDANEGDEILMPIGASSFVHMKVSSDKNVIVDIGSGISTEKTPEEASKFMEANAAELTEALKKSTSALQEVQQALQTVSEAVQIEYNNRQETPMQ